MKTGIQLLKMPFLKASFVITKYFSVLKAISSNNLKNNSFGIRFLNICDDII
jgi:hypothetical protein